METLEIWKDILEGKYSVSSLGNVKNNSTSTLIKLTSRRSGYLKLNICGKTYDVHRLVAETFLPNPENKNIVNHIDGNKKNNTLTNLEWATESENTLHAYKTGLLKIKRGESKCGCKLNEEKVNKIKKLISENVLVKDIASSYGVSRQLISKIKSNKGWKHVSC